MENKVRTQVIVKRLLDTDLTKLQDNYAEELNQKDISETKLKQIKLEIIYALISRAGFICNPLRVPEDEFDVVINYLYSLTKSIDNILEETGYTRELRIITERCGYLKACKEADERYEQL